MLYWLQLYSINKKHWNSKKKFRNIPIRRLRWKQPPQKKPSYAAACGKKKEAPSFKAKAKAKAKAIYLFLVIISIEFIQFRATNEEERNGTVPEAASTKPPLMKSLVNLISGTTTPASAALPLPLLAIDAC